MKTFFSLPWRCEAGAVCSLLLSACVGLGLVGCLSRPAANDEATTREAKRARLLIYEPASTLEDRLRGSAEFSAGSAVGEGPARKAAGNEYAQNKVTESSHARFSSAKEKDELLRRGLSEAKAGRLNSAALYFEEAERHMALGEKELLASALLRYEMGDLERSLGYARTLWSLLEKRRTRTLEEDLSQSPYREAALMLGLVELQTHNWRVGLERIEALVTANPRWEPPYVALAEHYLKVEAALLAEKVARAALDALPAPGPEVYVLLARAERRLGALDDAKRTLQRGIGKYPNDAGVLLWLGTLDFDAGFLTAACERFNLAYERGPHLPEAAFNVALCLTRKGEWERAESVLKLAIAKKPNVPSLRMLYGSLAKMRGNLLQARQAWQDFLSLAGSKDPNRAYVEAALDDLAMGWETEIDTRLLPQQ